MTKKIVMNVPYFQVPNDIFEEGLSSYHLAVYMYLCRCGNHGGAAFPSYNTIAKKCGMSKRKAIDVVAELESKGLLRKMVRPKSNKDNYSNLYEVVTPSERYASGGAQCALAAESPAPYKEPIYKELPIKNYNNENEKGQNIEPRSDVVDKLPRAVIADYLSVYRSYMDRDHPVLRRGQWERVAEEIAAFDSEHSPDWGAMIDRHFERGMDTDYNINHFATAGVLTNILYEIGL